MVHTLNQKLNLSVEQQAKLTAIIDTAIQKINRIVSEHAGADFLDIASVSHQLETVAESAQSGLMEFLKSDQMEEIKTFFVSLVNDAVDTIRTAIVDRIAQVTGLRAEQINRLRPILKEALAQRSALLQEFTRRPETILQDFVSELEALQEQTRRDLSGTLDAEQLDAVRVYQQKLIGMIQNLFAVTAELGQ
jgi:hypothetical protein